PPWDASIQETLVQEIGLGATQARVGEAHRGLPLRSAQTDQQAPSAASTIGPEEPARAREVFRSAGGEQTPHSTRIALPAASEIFRTNSVAAVGAPVGEPQRGASFPLI